MTTQLVKKKFGGKRQGYKGLSVKDIPWKTGIGVGNALWWGKDIIAALQHMGAFKHGGRVRGIGKAKRGFGRAMKRKR
jgi:hypothetical protein